jgi:hypothetical protein
VQPIFARSCVACHTKKSDQPAGNLVLDADNELADGPNGYGKLPGTYVRLAFDEAGKFGHKPPTYDSWGYPNASRYIRKLQSRRSLLTWKIYGERLDGFTNDDHPSEPKPGDRKLVHHGKDTTERRHYYDIDFVGSQMPPPDAVKAGKVQPLSDEDRRTIVRWIDLGCPLDLDYDKNQPNRRGYGFAADDNRPVLTLTYPQPNNNARLDRILIGMDDYYSGLREETFKVTADFELAGHAGGENLARHFKTVAPGVWEWKLDSPLEKLETGLLKITIYDQQGNKSEIRRRFSVGN